VPSPWDDLTEPELNAVSDLLYTLRQPSRHSVLTENFCIVMSGPGPDARPVERPDLVSRLRKELERAKLDGLDPGKIYRAALEVQPRMAANPLLPRPLPTFEEVKP
jgi:hypothetical protein